MSQQSNDGSVDFERRLEMARADSREIVERLFAAARPEAVFGEPVSSGDYTVITANEVTAGGGFGYGAGGGSDPKASGGGAGVGGGGGSMGRPVAVISIGPDGVKVQPIVDPTKIAIAGITAWAAMLLGLFRLRRVQSGRGAFPAAKLPGLPPLGRLAPRVSRRIGR